MSAMSQGRSVRFAPRSPAAVSLLMVLLPSSASAVRARRIALLGKVLTVAVSAAVALSLGFSAAVTGLALLVLSGAVAALAYLTWEQLDRYVQACAHRSPAGHDRGGHVTVR